MAATVTGWIAYALARGDVVEDDADTAAALVRAQDYIKYRYVARLLPGYDETLAVVEPATYEAAKLELATPGFWSKTYTPDERKVLTGVEGIKWTVIGGGKGGFQDASPTSSLIEAMFDPYIYDSRGPHFALRSIGSVA